MDQQTLKKWNRLRELEETIKKAEKEIEEILNPQKVVAPPPSFDWNEAAFAIIKHYPQGIEISQLLEEVRKAYPEYDVNRKKVTNILLYLTKHKKLVEKMEQRGFYRPKPENPTPSDVF